MAQEVQELQELFPPQYFAHRVRRYRTNDQNCSLGRQMKIRILESTRRHEKLPQGVSKEGKMRRNPQKPIFDC